MVTEQEVKVALQELEAGPDGVYTYMRMQLLLMMEMRDLLQKIYDNLPEGGFPND